METIDSTETLRDTIALEAIKIFLKTATTYDRDIIAGWAYTVADAMIEERAKRSLKRSDNSTMSQVLKGQATKEEK